MRYLSFVITIAVLLTVTSTFGQPPKVAQIFPRTGVNQNALTVHAYGEGFQGPPVTAAWLSRAGYPDIAGAAIDVTSDNHMTCSVDLTGGATGLYDIVLQNSQGSDTLRGCFTVYSSSPFPYIWAKSTVGALLSMFGVAVGDGNGDGEPEVYAANMDGSIYQFKWFGSGWGGTSIGSGGPYMYRVAVGDGNNDGRVEVYGANSDTRVYQFWWNGMMWEKRIVGAGGDYMYGVAVGDGNCDGQLEVYGANVDGNIYQYKWDGASWMASTVGSGGSMMYSVAVEDGNEDEELEVYGANADGNIYQYKWGTSNWTRTTVGSGDLDMREMTVGDGNGDGAREVYGANWDCNVYQFKWTGSAWQKTTVGTGSGTMYGVAVGNGDGDGQVEVYAANQDANIYEYWWDGGGWQPTVVGSGDIMMYGVAVGDGNGDGEMEVYGADWDGSIYQFKASSVGIEEEATLRRRLRFTLRVNPALGKAIFDLTVADGAPVTLKICDAAGRIVGTLLDQTWIVGSHEIQWIPREHSGVYFYILDSPSGRETGKLVLIK